MVLYEVFTLFLWLSVCSSLTVQHDFRYISYQDLQPTIDKFSHNQAISFSQMLFDVARNQMLVGARDVLYRLSLPKLRLLEYAEWPAPRKNRTQCLEKGQSEEHCHNYIKILLSNGKQIFTCGTNAYSPQCSYRKIENISEVTEWVDGLAKCPHSPESNITGFMSENGEYYFGGPTDFSGSDSLISKSINSHYTIRTKQYNSLWLNEPQFVGSFETDKFVYFLFKEAAVEYINCGKIVYSRIARVCKSDSGGNTMLKDNWTTFLKARLNCSISGEYPFYFNEIQSMSYVPNENLVYATFTTPINSIAGSAICAFNLTSIDRAFDGPFKYQDRMESSWGKQHVHHREHFKCESASNSHLLETSKYQLMDSAVQATTLSPLHVSELERFTHITIDVLSTKLHNSVHVIFVATNEGLIKKISVLPRTQETCVVEIWQTTPDFTVPIKSIQFLKETNSVYVTTELSVLKIPVDHCARHRSRDSCLNAMDPYCGFNERSETCTPSPNSNPLDKNWKQSVTSCPVLDAIVDGGWGSWSDWTRCVHKSDQDSDSSDNCLCQTRECNNPAPINGGLPCVGPSIGVVNCTVHGEWSDWSQWSACSATCGVAVKTRSRTCTNPAPGHGGRVCVGQDRTEAFCAEIPPCPASPQDGGWSDWTNWTPCSAHCGGGLKTRKRSCDSPPPRNGGQHCVGNDIEVDKCNDQDCPEQKKHHFTEWVMDANKTGGNHKSRRLKITCKAPVKSLSNIKIVVKEETSICDRSRNCITEENEHSRWGPWSVWGECSASCGGGQQNRTRLCEGRNCQGLSVQTRDCHQHPCQDEWRCWSEWSPCNVSCGWGVQTRYRSCLGTNCKGTNREEQPCEKPACDSLLGWEDWSGWSICDEFKEQHRKRKCRTENPGPSMCKGDETETRMCLPEYLNAYSGEAGKEMPEISRAAVGSFTAIIGAIVGFIAGAGSMHLYHKKRRNVIPSSPHYMSSKQNPYISMPLKERKRTDPPKTNNFLNNINESTKYADYETATLKRNSHTLKNGHHQKPTEDDKFYFD